MKLNDCDQLGIEVIIARSAQGKGPVERSRGVYQDRFVKELRPAGINEIESDNALLTESSLDTVNKRFSKPPIDPVDAHVPLLPTQSPADILCRKEPRVVSCDYVVRFHNRILQVMPSHLPTVVRPGTRVEKSLDSPPTGMAAANSVRVRTGTSVFTIARS